MDDSQNSECNQQLHDSIPQERLPKLRKKQQATFLNKLMKDKPLNSKLLYQTIPYTVFFQEKRFIRDKIPIYITGIHQNKLQVQTNNKPICICFHGAGQSAMTFCQITKNLKRDFIVLAYDMSLHGQSKVQRNPQSDLSELRLSNLVKQGVQVLKWVFQNISNKSKIFFIGHSLGGSICARVAKHYLNQIQGTQISNRITGLVLIDAIEGAVKSTKQNMKRVIDFQPKQFKSIQAAIWWTVSSQNINRLQSARASVPSKIRQVIVKNQKQQNVSKHYEMKVKLLETAPMWEEWFDGLSQIFINLPIKKLLFTSSVNRLDSELLQAYQQKLFKLQIFTFSGHFIHEDQYEKASKIVFQQFQEYTKLDDINNKR